MTEQTCRINAQLLRTVQLAYRKHVLNDDTIGWGELEDRLQTALANAMGTPAFQVWLEAMVEEASNA